MSRGHGNHSDGDIGYGKPPKSGRFEKGRSGNPKGRPKGQKNIAAIFAKVVYQKITVKEGGKTRRVTRFEAATMQLTNKAASGNVAAAKELIRWAEILEQQQYSNLPPPSLIVNFIQPPKRNPDGTMKQDSN
jgi:Family of unknown function (DUF5681)